MAVKEMATETLEIVAHTISAVRQAPYWELWETMTPEKLAEWGADAGYDIEAISDPTWDESKHRRFVAAYSARQRELATYESGPIKWLGR